MRTNGSINMRTSSLSILLTTAVRSVFSDVANKMNEICKSRSVSLNFWENFDQIGILTVEPLYCCMLRTITHIFVGLFYHFRPITAPSVFVAPALRSSDTSNRKSLRIQILVITNWIVLRRVKKSWLSSPPACGSELASLYYVIFYSQLLF